MNKIYKSLFLSLFLILILMSGVSPAAGQDDNKEEKIRQLAKEMNEAQARLLKSVLDFRKKAKDVVFDELYRESERPNIIPQDILYLYGWSFLIKGAPDKAKEVFIRLAESSPDSADAHFCCANFYSLLPQPQFDKAISEYDKAISLNPQYIEAYLNKAVTQFLKALSKVDQKLAVSFAVQQMWPEETEDTFKEALNILDKALTLNPDSRNLFCIQYNRGVILNTLFKERQAIDAFSKAIAVGGLQYSEIPAALLSVTSEKEYAYINGEIPLCFASALSIYWLGKMSPAAGSKKNMKLHLMAQDLYPAGANDALAFAYVKRAIAYSKANIKDYGHAIEDCREALKLNPYLKTPNILEAVALMGEKMGQQNKNEKIP